MLEGSHIGKTQSKFCMVDETYSTIKIENSWKMQWKGDMFSHGSEHSRGVVMLIKNPLESELKSVRQDSQGRFIILQALVQDQNFLFVNIYAPNKISEQILFLTTLKMS